MQRGITWRYEVDDDGVIRSRVLPGFQFRWDDLLQRLDIEELALDEVYSGYVWKLQSEACGIQLWHL